MEIWKPVVGFEGLYEVSDLGRVRSLNRVVYARNRWGNTAPRKYPGKLLKPGENKNRGGRRFVNLHDDSGSQVKLVAHLVAAAFIGPRPAGLQVCHNNGNAQDDRAVNLRYDTPKSNMADCLEHGTRKRGANHPAAKLSKKQVVRIRCAAKGGVDQALIARKFGVTQQHISSIATGRRWAHV